MLRPHGCRLFASAMRSLHACSASKTAVSFSTNAMHWCAARVCALRCACCSMLTGLAHAYSTTNATNSSFSRTSNCEARGKCARREAVFDADVARGEDRARASNLMRVPCHRFDMHKLSAQCTTHCHSKIMVKALFPPYNQECAGTSNQTAASRAGTTIWPATVSHSQAVSSAVQPAVRTPCAARRALRATSDAAITLAPLVVSESSKLHCAPSRPASRIVQSCVAAARSAWPASVENCRLECTQEVPRHTQQQCGSGLPWRCDASVATVVVNSETQPEYAQLLKRILHSAPARAGLRIYR